jgi:hypothetical protein
VSYGDPSHGLVTARRCDDQGNLTTFFINNPADEMYENLVELDARGQPFYINAWDTNTRTPVPHEHSENGGAVVRVHVAAGAAIIIE